MILIKEKYDNFFHFIYRCAGWSTTATFTEMTVIKTGLICSKRVNNLFWFCCMTADTWEKLNTCSISYDFVLRTHFG